MRIAFSDLNRPKNAAKQLARFSPTLKLSTAQEALARALGYRDWHELAVVVGLGAQAAQTDVSTAEVLRIVTNLADTLSLPDTEVLYAVSKARLLPGRLMTLKDHLDLTATIWRQRLFGPAERGRPGTLVRVKADGTHRTAYLRSLGRPSFLIYDTGLGNCADFEVVTPRMHIPDFVPACLWLPYGYWTLEDGSEVLFSRNYIPMWRISGEIVERLEPSSRIEAKVSLHHYSTAAGTSAWASGPAHDLALAHLERHRIRELPRLIDVMPHLVDPRVSSIEDATARL